MVNYIELTLYDHTKIYINKLLLSYFVNKNEGSRVFFISNNNIVYQDVLETPNEILTLIQGG